MIYSQLELASFCTFLTTAWTEPRAVQPIRGEPGSAANHQAPPILITWLFRKTCKTRRSGGFVSSRNVEHDRGESSGSAVAAARRAGHPWTVQMDRKMS